MQHASHILATPTLDTNIYTTNHNIEKALHNCDD